MRRSPGSASSPVIHCIISNVFGKHFAEYGTFNVIHPAQCLQRLGASNGFLRQVSSSLITGCSGMGPPFNAGYFAARIKCRFVRSSTLSPRATPDTLISLFKLGLALNTPGVTSLSLSLSLMSLFQGNLRKRATSHLLRVNARIC